MTWIVQPLSGARTAHDSKEAGEAEQVRIRPMVSVLWWCDGIEEVPAAVEIAPVSDSSGGVVSGVIRKLLGPQIATREIK